MNTSTCPPVECLSEKTKKTDCLQFSIFYFIFLLTFPPFSALLPHLLFTFLTQDWTGSQTSSLVQGRRRPLTRIPARPPWTQDTGGSLRTPKSQCRPGPLSLRTDVRAALPRSTASPQGRQQRLIPQKPADLTPPARQRPRGEQGLRQRERPQPALSCHQPSSQVWTYEGLQATTAKRCQWQGPLCLPPPGSLLGSRERTLSLGGPHRPASPGHHPLTGPEAGVVVPRGTTAL